MYYRSLPASLDYMKKSTCEEEFISLLNELDKRNTLQLKETLSIGLSNQILKNNINEIFYFSKSILIISLYTNT